MKDLPEKQFSKLLNRPVLGLEVNKVGLYLESFIINVTPFNQERMVRVYLPFDYSEGMKNYPVLYIHDGQTVFCDEDVSDGISLRLKEHLDRIKAKVIVVGIDSNLDGNQRVNEYSPWVNVDFSKRYMEDGTILGGRAEEYLQFLVHELIPLINNKYRTAIDSTYMAGCSMGGLFSTYAGCKYPKVFKKIAALSSSYWFNKNEIEELIKNSNLEFIEGIYLDCGTEEGTDEESKSHFIQTQRDVYQLLSKKVSNIQFNIIEGAGHNLPAFRGRIPDVISFFSFE